MSKEYTIKCSRCGMEQEALTYDHHCSCCGKFLKGVDVSYFARKNNYE